MAEVATKKLTRKEKIAEGLEKAPKRKKTYAENLEDTRRDQVKAVLNNCQIAPRKMRMVIDLIRGMEVDHALNVLKFTQKGGAEYVRKLLLSAVANWQEKNDGLSLDDGGLVIEQAFVDSSRMLKRFQPAPQGRAHRIRKRSCHVTLIIGTKEEELN